MKLPSKTVITLISIPIVILLFFCSNIYGYFRFKHYCATEGGLRVYEKLEGNVGWWANDKYDAQIAAQLNGVGFVRYMEKKDGKIYDLHYSGGNPNKNDSYGIVLADSTKDVMYKWLSIYESIENESRLDKFGQKIITATDGRVLVTSYSIKYEFFNRDHMFLDMANKEYCPSIYTEYSSQPNSWLNKFNVIFKR